MDITLLASLAVLALIDSTSFGTLLIPIWLMIHPGPVRPGRIMIFLGTVAAFYFAVGVAVALGANALLPEITRILDTRAAQWTLLVIGVALFFWSFRLGRKNRPGTEGRLARWRGRVMAEEGGAAALAGLALVAALIEVSTMLPYLGAIGLITAADLPVPMIALVMAGYCLVMILPALVLMGLRLAGGRRLVPVLTRISDWMTNSDTVSWIVGIAGFLLAREAAANLYLIDF
ncbi:GAP family protein [Actinoplanes sp. G11-F43]|uniref:GAP family protein n=1 Tax=Actinoplanes sp. G11-F43 TaxID=3424130 RepID=UPI003D353303